MEGLRYVWGWPGLRALLLMAMVINFVFTPAGSLLPLLVTERFGRGALEMLSPEDRALLAYVRRYEGETLKCRIGRGGLEVDEAVDVAAVKAVLPHGEVTVNVRHGGLDVPDPDNDDICVIASAAIDVSYDFDNA